MHVGLQSLAGEEEEVDLVLAQQVEHVFVGLDHLKPYAGEKAGEFRMDRPQGRRKGVVVASNANSSLQSPGVHFRTALQGFEHAKECDDLLELFLGFLRGLHQGARAHEKRRIPIPAQFREHAVGARQTHSHPLGRTGERARAKERCEKVQGLGVDIPYERRQGGLRDGLRAGLRKSFAGLWGGVVRHGVASKIDSGRRE